MGQNYLPFVFVLTLLVSGIGLLKRRIALK